MEYKTISEYIQDEFNNHIKANTDYIVGIEEYDGKVLAITGKSDLQADYTCLDKISEFENVTTNVLQYFDLP